MQRDRKLAGQGRDPVLEAAEEPDPEPRDPVHSDSIRALIEHGTVGVWEITPDGRTLYANDAMCRLLEVSDRSELGQGTFHRFFTDSSFDVFRREHAKRAAGQASAYEVELVAKSGTVRHVRISGVPVLANDGTLRSLVGAFVDVSDFRRAEAELARNERNYRTLVEHASDAIVVSDPDGRIADVNESLCRLLGYSRQELLSMHADDFLRAEDLATDPPGFDKLRRGEAIFRERTLRCKDGSEVVVETSAKALPDGRFLAFLRDLRDRKRAEEERLALEQQLGRSQRLEALGRLAGGVAHDFNNLLTVILGHTEAVIQDSAEGSSIHEDARHVQDAATRAVELTRQLLAFGRKQVLHVQSVDLNERIDTLCSLLRRLLPETIEVRTNCSSEPLHVDADPAQLDQIVMNLALNARDAMPQGGLLTIATGSVRAPPERSSSPPSRDYALLTVTDTGHGMDENTQAHLFEPFFTTKANGRGTGLGLAVIYGLVNQHGGWIEAESAPEQGATFKVYLPTSASSAGGMDAPGSGPRSGPVRAKSILVVEDEEAVRRIASRALARKGYIVHSVGDPDEALALVTRKRVDLVLTDVVMPKMNGVRLSKLLRERVPGLRVLYMSGYPLADSGPSIDLDDPLVSFIAKPFSARSLLDRVRRLLDAS